ncbi:tape measure protein [Rhodobacter phage RcKemmy]|nr:tape measure protein [Rhodobacter phage RcKemmy]
MAERKVSVRLGVVGGKEVEATFLDLGNKGGAAMRKLGDESEQAFQKVANSSRMGGGGLQNVGYQVQDFAVQVGAGTSATQALAQQLPQLLSGFGLFGVLAGTAAAILIPIAGYFFNMGEEAETATKKIETLVSRIEDLRRINETYSTSGIQSLIDKYGELNAAVLLLLERQRQYAEREAMSAARDAVSSVGEEFEDVIYSLREYDSVLTLIARNNYGDVEAQRQRALLAITETLNDEYGLTLDQARDLAAAFGDLRAADTIPEMADATARLTGLLQDSKFAGTELEKTLLDSEDALRQLNAEGEGVGGWLGAAIDWASTLGGNLWDAARAAAAVRGAQAAPAGRGDPRDFVTDPYWRDRYFPDPEPMRPPSTRRTGAGGAGRGERDATADLEREAERIFESTRTDAERYADELKRLDQIKAAGLITGDTYNRQLQALGEQYRMEGDALATIQSRLEDFVKTSADIADGIGDAFVDAFSAGSDAVANFVKTGKLDFSSLITNFIADLARLAAQKYIFGPLANMLGGALGGLGGAFANILHEGGIAGSGGGRRSVDPSVFAGAPRFHSGGLAGDEVPAILQRGERVLSKSETAAYDRGGSPTIVFNVKDAASVRQSRSQIAADAARAVAMGRRNS